MNEKPKPGWREGREIEDEENGKQWNMEANQEEATLGQNSILFHRVGSIMLEFCIQTSHNFDCKIAMTAVMVYFRTKLSVIQERYVNVQIKWKNYFYRHQIWSETLHLRNYSLSIDIHINANDVIWYTYFEKRWPIRNQDMQQCAFFWNKLSQLEATSATWPLLLSLLTIPSCKHSRLRISRSNKSPPEVSLL